MKKDTKNTKKKINIEPLHDRVLVSIDMKDEMTKSGIIIPETVSKERPEEGVIIAVGKGKKLDDGKLVPLSVKVGDRVLFSKYGPDLVKVDGVEYYILREESILAILN